MSTPPLDPGRSRILAAAAIDAALLVGVHACTLVLATGWLLARTGAGRLDAGEGDAVLALAVAGAAAPAWVAWMLLATHRRLGTPGQRALRIRAVPEWGVPQWSLYVRAMASPLSLPGWLWMAATPLLAGMSAWLALPAALAAAAVALAGLGSLGIALLRPSARLLHDCLARTALVAVEP